MLVGVGGSGSEPSMADQKSGWQFVQLSQTAGNLQCRAC